jgi:hypothetical protein
LKFWSLSAGRQVLKFWSFIVLEFPTGSKESKIVRYNSEDSCGPVKNFKTIKLQNRFIVKIVGQHYIKTIVKTLTINGIIHSCLE